MRPLIFLADDDPLLCSLVELRLRLDGYRVQSAPDGRAALEQLEQLTPVLIILDQNMPRMNGLEVAQRLSGSHRLAATPIMMLTASAERDVVKGAKDLQAAAYLLKPFEPDVLAQRVAHVLSKGARAPRSAGRISVDLEF